MLLLGYLLLLSAALVASLRFNASEVEYNLNQNRTAINPVDYWGEWQGHSFHPSPSNWRFPFYTLFLDKFVNGDPQNDDANGTYFEHDVTGNQLRNGGDLAGLVDTLDYIQGMGIKGIYIAGSPFINAPWKSDSYSPLDLTLLDRHFGDIKAWRSAVDEIHKRNMYVILDNTMSTMGDLIGFNGFLNSSTPFSPLEHQVQYKTDRHYHDFDFGNTYKPQCQYPRFYDESGEIVLKNSNVNFSQLVGCYDSEFDQYGDTEAFGVFPDWQRQLSKFASTQDRLREWLPSVREKIQQFSCITIAMLDIDGYRFDKATQVTVDAQAEFGAFIRQCASRFGKDNFFMPGEITGGNTFGSIYLGRGRQPEQVPKNLTLAVTLTNSSRDDKFYIRDVGLNALDAAAFHYSIYRSLTRFLGMDGNLTAGYDVPVNFVDTWNTMLTTNDLANAYTGEFDPRHMYGATNQDVFRWPAITNGVERMLLGLFVTTLEMPGIPLLLWGEEQALYLLDNTAENYVFGRQPMSSALAWQTHGCYNMSSSQYYNFPVDAAKRGCNDDSVGLDHRDPSHPVRNIIKTMYQRRRQYPVLNDGAFLQSLSNQTHLIFLPGSNGTATELGMWSVMRNYFPGLQDQNEKTNGTQSVWLVYQNENKSTTYSFDCSSKTSALIAPFEEGVTVKNLLAPFDEIELKSSSTKLGIDGAEGFNGCTDEIVLSPWDFRAYVPKDQWLAPQPMLTGFLPGHDARILSKVASNQKETVDIELHFSEAMDCDQITQNLLINSTTDDNSHAALDVGTVRCSPMANAGAARYAGEVQSAWKWQGKLQVSNGIYSVRVENATTSDSSRFTDSIDQFLFRIGQDDNPMVFPRSANYSQDVLTKDSSSGSLQVTHKAAGADAWRYSTNWGSSWSDWAAYEGGKSVLVKQKWSGTKRQNWDGDHVILQYWNRMTGSSNHVQHADANRQKQPPRRFPHLFAHGPFNEFGFDGGLKSAFEQDSEGLWKHHLMTEWPSEVQINVWGMNPDKQPDQTYIYGDIDNDTVLDRLPPDSLTSSVVQLSDLPPAPFLAYRLEVNDADYHYRIIPVGNRLHQVILFALLWVIPVVSGAVSIWTYMGAYYGVKFNKIGVSKKTKLIPFILRRNFEKIADSDDEEMQVSRPRIPSLHAPSVTSLATTIGATVTTKRRTVLIATMEYDIEDWSIKIKIGGLGVMAQLMGKNLQHQDLIWVVPCVGGVEYPQDTPAPPMTVTILGNPYEVQVQYHKLNNITYVLLDAPIFRQQSKTEPYPPRMDDLDSAIYYSTWNACIAETIRRFPVEIYHINDYHGAAAPLYLLPDTIPCCLSLHNAEFQGLWPMRTPEERDEVCRVYNLDPAIVQKYVQFGEIFNLLHAGTSYLRVHQKGFGAVGVSKKYGARSYARYPIFWGLKEIGNLPNPDPTDLAPLDDPAESSKAITIDSAFERSRGDLRRQAQEWAGLRVDPQAELFVFVGRWSMQKGVDLIADVFPAVLDKNPKVQLIAVGPVIDLYGKFAALKLEAIMKKYPGRVYSKPEFTALPPYIFSGAEFALIPSRDEPFGLVAVEFGRKGALGVGARVGGLGQMPGWWYTVESTTTKHLTTQFKSAIEDALESKHEVRAMMRARSAKQRFPVAQWVQDLEKLQSASIAIHKQEAGGSHSISRSRPGTPPDVPEWNAPPPLTQARAELARSLSLGVRNGPGHARGRSRGSVETTLTGNTLADISEDHYRDDSSEDDYRGGSNENPEFIITREQAENDFATGEPNQTPPAIIFDRQFEEDSRGRRSSRSPRPSASREVSRSRSPAVADRLLALPPQGRRSSTSRGRNAGFYQQGAGNRGSVLSLSEIVGSRHDYKLQNVQPSFNDTSGEFHKKFEDMLAKNQGDLSKGDLCIADYLEVSEKAWFKKMRDAKLGRSRDPSPYRRRSRSPSPYRIDDDDDASIGDAASVMDEFLLGENYQRPSIVKRWLLTRIGDWPIYSLLLGLGQIMAVSSYQIALLTGGQGDTNLKLYIVGGVFMVTSCLWWLMFRTLKSTYVLSLPFLVYGLAFIFVGVAPFFGAGSSRDWFRNVAVGLYATASSSGSIYFALNFGDEGGAPVKSWVLRACLIQGTQQIYITGLFYWGKNLTGRPSTNSAVSTLNSTTIIPAVMLPIAAILWTIGIALFTCLPDYYHQSPGKTPYFYGTLLRRKIILWFFVTIVLQNYFLSTPYGRNWEYLWSSTYAKSWQVGLLVFVFFVVVWAAILAIFGKLSNSHSWILPVFAIGLGAPRWCQMLWGTSSFGLWVPWMPGGPLAGALAGRSLWLWLGVLDSVQGVGFGMMLLHTLTRLHIAVTLIASQLLGTGITLLAKATAPDKDGPGDVFPDFSAGAIQAISKPWFWIALACQLVIPVGFFMVFRKAQLSKP
ncbi:Cell wall alpha-1,3-glucan synthase ags1 [Cladophialophora chaetospira]|uniref:alpha-1,3-glucan synthase n=1 Tax=Cladophialophora chaetospira TaxID=386627 RepID=A0AA38XN72_9EURO|nr:Cell wall alpha-1,3-glucan synthase ags1 [Cladophialophora chaetospira]